MYLCDFCACIFYYCNLEEVVKMGKSNNSRRGKGDKGRWETYEKKLLKKKGRVEVKKYVKTVQSKPTNAS